MLGKSNRKNRAFAEFAADPDLRAVDHSGVLDDGEAQTGAAHFLGTTLVDPVKTLEDPVQIFSGNPDSVVLDGELCFARVIADADQDAASSVAIVNSVAA